MALPRRRSKFAPLALVLVVALAGCAGAYGGDATTTTTTRSGTVLTASEVPAEDAQAATAEIRVAFENLSAARREEFERALDADVHDPTAWGPGTDVEYVAYDGTWYAVHVVVEN
ncbi:MAG: hypothetical protein ABEJ70_04250 [Halobacteriaceae archaeon]